MLLNVQNNFQNMGIINNHGNVVSISWESNLGHVIFSGMWLHDGNFSLGIIPRNRGRFINGLPSGYVKIAIENGPFIVDLPIKDGDFP